MNIIVNGKPALFDGGSLQTLLTQQAMQPPFAVAVNTRFVPKSRYAETLLQEGDQVEIVRPVVGG
ncbi:sulfur carrier protein ThiS [Neisseria sp. ZJ106]|uniref:Sulfur carrier protein ThiS n=1 Tax=Neisseria lisongii TaxID=2912188 RepID=A0ABY7RHV1_9NEIS|nr:sulfur carrier protein ThiS [Neisseria lisongii]MCF7520848.1 sulfur carrier protein ThiS [Neisseria lisongii]WCL70781.1 sulfur carrier protein ThiS [Neisseria lisongii]